MAYKLAATPEDNEYTEFLTYEFTEKKLESCIVEMQWEKIALPIKIEIEDIIEIDVDDLIHQSIDDYMEDVIDNPSDYVDIMNGIDWQVA